MNICNILSMSFSMYDLQQLGPFLAMALFFLFGLVQLQKPSYCKVWHQKYWIRTEVKDLFGAKEEIVCKKCGHHFMK